MLNIFVNDHLFSQLKEKKIPYLNDFMLNKINTIFSWGLNKEKLVQNENTYDKFFSVFKADYDTNSTSLNYFKSIFHKISDFCTEKWICQEKLLDLSDNLGKIMNQAAEILQQISFTLEQSQRKENKLFDDLQCL